MNIFPQRKTHTDLEKGERNGTIRRLGVNIHLIIHIKYIYQEGPTGCQGRSDQCSLMTNMGNNLNLIRYMYMYE